MTLSVVRMVGRGVMIVGICFTAGCGTAHTVAPSPSPSPSPYPTVLTPPPPTSIVADVAPVIARDTRSLRATSYTPISHVKATMPDGTVLFIFHSLCTGSADGHCQAVDVFHDRAPKAIWHRQYVGVKSIHIRTNGFSVEAYNYGPQDPLCCPSLPPVTDTYKWTGSGFREFGRTPHQPGA